MASSSSTAYQLPNPKIVDPYPIEGQLLKDTSSPLAMALLYRSDRQAASDQYANELVQQHDQIRQQLAATMANNAAERTIGAMAHPGGLEYFANNPNFAWMGNTPDTPGLKSYAVPDKILQYGNAVKPGAEGVKALGDVGFFPSVGGVGNITGLDVNRETSIPERAAAARAQGTQDTQGTSVPEPMGIVAGEIKFAPVKKFNNESDEAYQQRVADVRRNWLLSNPSAKPLEGNQVTPGTGTGTTTPAPKDDSILRGPAPQGDGTDLGNVANIPGATAPDASPPPPPPRGVTNLPPAPKDTAAPASTAAPAGNTTSGQLVTDGKIQAAAKAQFRLMSPEIKNNVFAGMQKWGTSNNLPLYPAKGGGLVLKGADGTFYPIGVTP
jgi:hypothetical protein